MSTSRLLRQTLTPRLSVIPTSKIPTVRKSIRTMASASAPEKFEWLVIMPDQPGKLAKRMEVRPDHFEGLKAGVDRGFWKMGGALLEEVPKDGDGLKIQGSAMVALASSKEEVIEQLKADTYARNEVWDFSKVSSQFEHS
ncbi:YCII-related domain protein [Diplocarpon rosae]|nr:YCII-related domain protein [Diplocarpon rosae]